MQVKLSFILNSLESGGRPKGGATLDSKGIPSLGAEHLDSDGGFNFKSVKYIPEEYYEGLKNGIIEKENILIVKDGATTGKVSFVNEEFPFEKASVNEHVFLLKIDKSKAYPRFVFHYLKCPQGQRDVMRDFRGATVGGISRRFVEFVKFELPQLPDQLHIANILTKAENLIAQRKESIRLLDEFLKSTFLEMFGDPVRNEKRWENRTIEQLVKKEKYSLKRGPFGGALKKEIFVPSGYLVYEQFHALNNDFSFARYYINENKFQELKGFAVKPGDIIISCSGVYLGKLAIVPKGAKKGIINQALLKITLDDNIINSQFFVFLFSHESFKNKFYGNFIGSGIPNFPSMADFKKFQFIYPPLELQTKFGHIVEKTESLKTQHKNSLAELENLYGSLSQKAFKGELSFKDEILMMAAEPEERYSK